ncbi:MAG TPA: DUF4157 domain-containing protein [Thermoanaerobaculia bacterium]|nr:DUF4157 domain-containing protein [Thermoanaerobaculia bacterium]
MSGLTFARRRRGASQNPGPSPRVGRDARTHPASALAHRVLQSPGRPLDRPARDVLEARFGHDFSRVRVHSDDEAARSASALGARAYTVGRHVVFGGGRSGRSEAADLPLVAHELTHTLQQGLRPYDRNLDLEPSGRGAGAGEEREADAASAAVAQDRPARVSAGSPSHVALQKDEGPEKPKEPAKPAKEKEKGSAPSCPVQSTGTLSEVSWGETSGLYPSSKNKYDPSKWDAAKTCELLRMRGAVHAVGQRGERVHKGKPKENDSIEQKLKSYHLVENFPALDPQIKDAGVKWFYLSPSAESSHPGIKGEQRVKSYGKFYNIGGGDVARGDVYVHFFNLKPKSESKPSK